MKKKLLTLLILFSFVTSLLTLNTHIAFGEDETETFNGLIYDADLNKSNANYLIARNATSSTYLDSTSSEMWVGQWNFSGIYTVIRCFVYFDTSILQDDVVISEANLTLSLTEDYSDDDFKICIRNGQPTYPHIPAVKADYYYTHYSGNAGELDTNGISLNTPYDINITELSWISKTTTTKLALISSNDKDSVAPAQKEYVLLATAEHSNSTLRPKLTVKWSYSYIFKGLYDETSGNLTIAGVDVTAYFADGTSPAIFNVNGTYEYAPSSMPLYFKFDLLNDREYWLATEETVATIYIFNASTTTYTISFLDLAGVLETNPYVVAKRYINGTLFTVEKRMVDVEKKIVINLVNGAKYTLTIQDGASYTYGDLTMTSTTTLQLTLKGTDFPKETLLTSKNVRIYGERVFGTPNGNITITYQDLLNMTNAVEIYINYKNGTNAYNATESSSSFVHTWTSALNNTDYIVEADIYHAQYGSWTWRQYFPRSMSTAPWGLDFLGTSLPFATSILIPAFLILFAGACFSVINAEVGAFMMVIIASVFTYKGWIPIAPGALITAISLSILMGIIYAKRRVQT